MTRLRVELRSFDQGRRKTTPLHSRPRCRLKYHREGLGRQSLQPLGDFAAKIAILAPFQSH